MDFKGYSDDRIGFYVSILVGVMIFFCFSCIGIGNMMTVFLMGSFCIVLFIIDGLLNCILILKLLYI